MTKSEKYRDAERYLRLALDTLPADAVNMRTTVAAMAEQARGRYRMLMEREAEASRGRVDTRVSV
ncbi:MAG: hypothetical protein NVSMB22_22560 [Chloroflexota bacterium]